MPETGPSKALRRLAAILIDRRRPVLAVVAVVTIAFGYFAFQGRIEFRFTDLLPQKHPYIQTHLEYGGTFGESNSLVIMLELEEGSVFTVETLTTLFRATEALEQLPGVNHDLIDSLAHRSTRWIRVEAGGMVSSKVVMRRPPVDDAEVRRIHRIVRKSPHIFGVLVSVDEKALILRAGFHEHRVDYRALYDAVNEKILSIPRPEGLDVHVAGRPRLYGWVYQYFGEVLAIFGGTVLLVWILLYVYFGDWRGALRPTISGGLAAVWGLGFTRLLGFSLDPLALIVPFFITARAVSHSVQMHDRYYDELDRGRDQREAIVESFAALFVPTLSGILSDALGILVILLVPIVMLQKLAISASFWILTIVVSELLLNPIVYSYLRPPPPEVIERRKRGLWRRGMATLGRTVSSPSGRWVTVGALGGVLLVSAWFVSQMTIGDPTSVSKIFWPDHPFNVSHRAIQERFGGVEPLIIVAEGKEDTLKNPDNLRTIETFQRHMERDFSVGASFSLVDILTSINTTFHEMEPKWGVIPDNAIDVAGYFFLFWTGAPPSESARYFAPDFSASHLTLFCKNHEVRNVRRLVARAEHFIENHPLENARFRMAGGLIGVLAAVYEEVIRHNFLMHVYAFSAIFLICAWTYGSFVAALLLLTPVFVANAVVSAYMGARGIGIDLNTLPVVTVGVGFGIDYGIYVLSRIREEAEAVRTLPEAVTEALASAGRAVAFTGFTMIGSVLLWTFSTIRFEAEMGMLLAIWMLFSMGTALTLLPALVVISKPRFLVPGRNGAADSGTG